MRPSWGANPPTFQLTLLYGDQLGALTTLTLANSITAAIANEYGNVWKQVEPELQGDRPYWKMQPDPNGGGNVLGTGVNATIEFSFTGIQATLPPGVDSAITVAYVSWSSIPGYRDGAIGIPVTRLAGPQIASFSADPQIVGPGQTTMQTVLSWQAAHADGVTFQVPGVPEAEEFDIQGSGPIPGGITTPATQALGITAFRNVLAARPTAGDQRITDTQWHKLSVVTRTDIALPVADFPVLVLLPGAETAYVFWYMTASYIKIDLSTGTAGAPVNLQPLVKPPLTVLGTQTAVSTADGKTLYIGAQASDPPNTPWLLTFDVESETVTAQSDIGPQLQSNQVNSPYVIALTPDGKTIFASTLVTTTAGNDSVEDPYELLVIDAASLSVTTRHPWGTMPETGPVMATSADGTKIFTRTFKGAAILDTTDGALTPVTSIDLTDPGQLVPLLTGVLTPDGRQIYMLTFDITTINQDQGTATGYITAIDVGVGDTTLSVGDSVLLGTLPVTDDALEAALLGMWDSNWSAVSTDGSTVYVFAQPDIAVLDRSTGGLQVWPAANPAEILATPNLLAGPRPATAYCVLIEKNGCAMSTITLSS
jgi:hypothetical protein